MKKNNFITARLNSFYFAFKGLYYLVKTEPNFQIHCLATVLMTALGFYYNLSPTEWVIQCLVIALVLTLEAINTAIEKSLNVLHPKQHKGIGLAKDIAASAVLIAAIFACVIASIIYIPKL